MKFADDHDHDEELPESWASMAEPLRALMAEVERKAARAAAE